MPLIIPATGDFLGSGTVKVRVPRKQEVTSGTKKKFPEEEHEGSCEL